MVAFALIALLSLSTTAQVGADDHKCDATATEAAKCVTPCKFTAGKKGEPATCVIPKAVTCKSDSTSAALCTTDAPNCVWSAKVDPVAGVCAMPVCPTPAGKLAAKVAEDKAACEKADGCAWTAPAGTAGTNAGTCAKDAGATAAACVTTPKLVKATCGTTKCAWNGEVTEKSATCLYVAPTCKADAADQTVCTAKCTWTASVKGEDATCVEDPAAKKDDAPAAKKETSVKGDPHVTGLRGEQFDISKEGRHTLVWIPRDAPETLQFLGLHVFVAQLTAVLCESLFVERLHMTGTWLGDAASLQFRAGTLRRPGPLSVKAGNGQWQLLETHNRENVKVSSHKGGAQAKVNFGKITVTVSHIRHPYLSYLNVGVKGLETVSVDVGGLLGEDSHEAAAAAPRNCHDKKLASHKKK